MIKEKMTIHKALSELKIINDRIVNIIDEAVFCVENKHSNEKIKGVTIAEYKNIIQGNYDKVSSLINRRNAIKRAVVLSNAITKVIINDVEYTIAEAIEMKNHGVEFDRLLLQKLRSQYNKAQSEILRQNGDDLERRAEQYVIGLYGSKESKVNSDEFEKTKNTYLEAQSYELVDPIKILEKIAIYEDKISKFTAEVDAALSTSNALTEIEIEY